MKCLNCGRREAAPPSPCCKECDDAGDRLEQLLRQGITLEYDDGSVETIKTDQQSQ